MHSMIYTGSSEVKNFPVIALDRGTGTSSRGDG